MYEVVT